MILLLAGLALTALTGFALWRVTERAWHLLVVAVLALPLMASLAATVTGDVSRYLPGGMFSEGPGGKNEIILVSAGATMLLAVLLAACLFGFGKAAWRRWRSRRAG
jgi:hypothetical protein